ncbi:MAG TPA: FAD-dependent oxidoreductase, partial [Symbiobacteriaceae bacterium]|nr:FAD-dependent oxidoreductase [Symbiobacteriaceae bacterium]
MYDLIIVGGGPAGLTASIYGGRAGLSTLLIEQAAMGAEDPNWPGEGPVTGPELMQRFRNQAVDLGVVMVQDDVADLDLLAPVKVVVTGRGDRHEARAVILAPGGEGANTVFLAGTGIRLDELGYIVADADTMATNLDGVFAAGDARRKWLRQTITAAADGAIAACSAERYIAQAERFEQEVLAPKGMV